MDPDKSNTQLIVINLKLANFVLVMNAPHYLAACLWQSSLFKYTGFHPVVAFYF